MIQHHVTVLENVQMAERTYRLRLADRLIGARIRPGQFVMLRASRNTDPLLARPFALYDTFLDDQGHVAGYDLVYLVVGKVTGLMSVLSAGQTVEVWGPLGNGFSLEPAGHVAMIAGGIGQTPFPAVARALLKKRQYGEPGDVGSQEPDSTPRVTVCYGVRSAAYLAGLDDFRKLGVDLRIATDDGSAGHHGFVTDIVQQMINGGDRPTQLLGCGPEPMMHRLAQIADRAGIPCELSLETPMACGVGACFSCVAQIRQSDGRYDYRRVCVEGPVFAGNRVKF